jgi:hypothetical protein
VRIFFPIYIISFILVGKLHSQVVDSTNGNSDSIFALNKGINYINGNIVSKDGFAVYPLLLFLKTQKASPIELNINMIYGYADSISYNLVKPLVAFGSVDSSDTYPIERLDEHDYLTKLMYYCFNYPKIDNIDKIKYYIKKVYKLGNYEATHCYLSLLILRKRSNTHTLHPSLSYYFEYVKKATLKLANAQSTAVDLKIESIAILSEDNIGLIDRTSIEYLLGSQNADGSWCNKAGQGEQNKMHTTVLAVWALTNWFNK